MKIVNHGGTQYGAIDNLKTLLGILKAGQQELYKLYEDGTEALIESHDDLCFAYGKFIPIGIEIESEGESARELLKSQGFYTESLWHIEDVKSKFECTDEQALKILGLSLENEATMEQIWFSIREFGNIEGLKEIE